MSIEEIKRFQTEAKEKEDIQKALSEAGSDIDKVVSIASENGYDFTKEELIKFAEEQKSKLSDEDLKSVAGGTGEGAAAVSNAVATVISLATGVVV